MSGHDPETMRAVPADGPPTRPADPTTPRRIGRYSILRTLGRGGMGVVYLAHDETENREVALKVIPAGPDADPEDLARFRAEAQAVTRLHHPNIVSVYDVGETEGVAFLAMEYVPGGNLYRRISRGHPLSPDEAARLVEQIARGAQHAHERGIIHRDLKPSNILLGEKDRPSTWVGEAPTPDASVILPANPVDWLPKIADFGLAKQLNNPLHLTRSGMTLGTPNYMAPEQARGRSDQIGPTTDVHALGAVLYELLVGYPPFNGGSAMETMQQVASKKPMPPSQLRHGVPKELEAICLKALEKAPARRYRTAAEMVDALRKFRDGPGELTLQPTVSIRPPEESRSGPPWRAMAVAAAIVVGLAVVGILGVVVGQKWAAQNATDPQEPQRQTGPDRYAQVEAAIALCERGQIEDGLIRLELLQPNDDLPIKELIEAWSVRRLRPAKVPPGLNSMDLAIDPTGEHIAVADGGNVEIREAATGKIVGKPWPVGEAVTALAWSEDGQTLVAGTATGRVLVGGLQAQVFGQSPALPANGEPAVAVSVSFLGARAVTQGNSLTLRYTSKKSVPALPEAVGAALAVGSSDLAVITREGSVRVYDAADEQWHAFPSAGTVTAIAYSPDRNALVLGTKNGQVRVWDAIARTPLTGPATVEGPVTRLAIGPGPAGYRVLAGNAQKLSALECGRPNVSPPIRLSRRPGKEVLGLAFSRAGERIYITTPSGVSRWATVTAKKDVVPAASRFWADNEYGTDGGSLSAGCLHTSADGMDSVITGAGKGSVRNIHGETGAPKPATMADVTDITAIASGPDGTVVATGKRAAGGSIVRAWAPGMGETGSVSELAFGVNAEAFLPDATAVALACDDGQVRFLDPKTHREVRAALPCESPVLALAVHPTRPWVLAGCTDGTAQLWDWKKGERLATVRHAAEVRGVVFRRDDLVTASADGLARRWHAGTSLPLGPAMAHADAITAVDAVGSLIATGGRGRYVRVWRVP